MLRVKERVGVMPEVEADRKNLIPSGKPGVVRIDVDVDSSGTVHVIPSVVTELCRSVVGSCLSPPLVPGGDLPVYHPVEIVHEGRRYVLRAPLECVVTWEDDAYFIRYRPFDLVATDYTLPGAILEFSSKFSFYYEHSNEIALSGVRRLGTRLESIRLQMNELVVEVCAAEGINMYQPLNQKLL
jgi:hypothetical protein